MPPDSRDHVVPLTWDGVGSGCGNHAIPAQNPSIASRRSSTIYPAVSPSQQVAAARRGWRAAAHHPPWVFLTHPAMDMR